MGSKLVPGFGIKSQITLLSMGLLAIPLVSFTYWQEVKDATLANQAYIQEIEAKAIATSLLATQENIPALLAANDESELFKHSLATPYLNTQLKLDGVLSDWPEQIVQKSLSQFKSDGHPDSSFSMRLAQSDDHLYIGIEVYDTFISYRRNHLRLDYNDHIQLSYQTPLEKVQRIIIPAERDGPLPSYFSNHEWEYGLDPEPDIASHETMLQGFWRRTDSGYVAEFRLPLEQMNTQNARLHVSVVDVDEQPSLGPKSVISTLPPSLDGRFNPLELHATELQRVIDHLKHTYAHLGIYDRRGREWALAGRDKEGSSFTLDETCLNNALEGQTQQYQRELIGQADSNRITTCYPITQDTETLGVVVIDESASHVLLQHKSRLQSIALKTGITIGGIIILMFVYALILARRISKLSQATRNAIDSHGRIISTGIDTGTKAPDELGDLARSISGLLVQQQSYTQFLERMPQTLRHEISNPLNKLRTSLENLLDEKQDLSEDRYIKKLDAGIDQIGNITQQLTEAASLESAMQNEPLQRINLNHFLEDYCSTWPDLDTKLPDEEVWIYGEHARLEQLLDKLLDNAFSFCTEGGKVSLSASLGNSAVEVKVSNDGPLIPQSRMNELFAPMTSTRSEGDAIHLGLGLHIAKIIADHHHAKLQCSNRADQSGVEFSLCIPQVEH